MRNKTLRNSSLELLRILCMLLIICHHYSVHGGYSAITIDSLGVGRIWVQMLALFGKIPCSIFAMISGFYLINSDERKHHYRKIIPIGAEMTFYSISIFLLMYFTKWYPVSFKDGIKSILAMIRGNWFVVGYLCLYSLVPFINPMLKSLSKNNYKIMLLVICITYSIIPTFLGTQNYGTLGFFIVMYALGAYIQLYYRDDYKYNNKYNLFLGLAFALLIILSTLAFDFLGYYFNAEIFVSHATYLMSSHSILALPCAFFTFLYFSNLNFYNKGINIIASTMMGVYLIHDNNIMRPFIWTVIYPNVNYVSSPFLHSAIKIIVVFIVCIMIDLVRQITIGKWFDAWFYKKADLFWNTITNSLDKIKERRMS